MASILESKITSTHKAGLIQFLKENPGYFRELIELAIKDKSNISWRAAWLTWSCMEKNDIRIQPFLSTLLEILPERKGNQQREFLMILQRMNLNEEQRGILFELCLNLWKQTDNQASLRVNAFKVLVGISQIHPGLKNELHYLAQPQYLETLSKGAKWSVQKMISLLFGNSL